VLWHAMHFRAGKPPPGLHLDVMKDGKMIQVDFYACTVVHCTVLFCHKQT